LKTIGKKALLFADLHLGIHQNSSRWHQLSFECADWACKIAKIEQVDSVICLGDYFHDRDQIDVSTLDVARKILNKFSDFKVYLITGNHDLYFKEKNDVTSLHIFEGYPYVNVVNNATSFRCGDKQITMIPWSDAHDEKNYAGDVILVHGEFKSFKMQNNKFSELGLDVELFRNEQKIILAGHYHISDIRNMGKLKIGYLGNPFQHTFGDINNNKFIYTIDFENIKLQSFENEFSPRHEIIRYSKKESPKRKNSIVKIIYDVSDTPEKYTSFASEIQENYKPFTLLTQTDFELKSDAVEQESNISFEQMLESFVDEMDIQNKKETLEYCRNLYKRCL
jgi:DNA repair exonuclease SbcCD nuclease subunit